MNVQYVFIRFIVCQGGCSSSRCPAAAPFRPAAGKQTEAAARVYTEYVFM